MSNCAGCKRYVSGSFIAFPEMFLDKPLVIDSSFIEHNQQVVLLIWEKSDSAVIGLQSSINIQHVSGLEYIHLKQRAIKLGQKVKSLQGNNCVRDGKTPFEICSKFGLPFGFDGPMHAFGMNVDLYSSKHLEPVLYRETQGLMSEINKFAHHCLPLLK